MGTHRIGETQLVGRGYSFRGLTTVPLEVPPPFDRLFGRCFWFSKFCVNFSQISL